MFSYSAKDKRIKAIKRRVARIKFTLHEVTNKGLNEKVTPK